MSVLKIKHVFTIIFSFGVFAAYAQIATTADLKQKLAAAKTDSDRMQILADQSSSYQDVNPDSMVYYAQRVVLLSIKNRNIYPADFEVDALALLAGQLWYAGNYPDAQETYFKALAKAETIGDPILVAEIYNGLAAVNRNEGNFRRAIYYYSKSEALARHLPDNGLLLAAIIDKGKAYEQLGILDSAFIYVQESMAIIMSKHHNKNVTGGGIHAEMGIIYSKMGKEKLADDYFRLAFQLNSAINQHRLLARSYFEFAEHFDRYHQRDSAIYYATKGLLMDKKYHYLVQQLAASTLLSKLYNERHNIDSAFKYQQLMIGIRDSVFSLDKITRLQNLEFNEQLRQREVASEKKLAAQERKENIQYALIAVGLFIFTTLFLLLSRSFITNSKWIEFLGVITLLILFEFINLIFHPFLEQLTHHSPALMLLALVAIAALLVPLHHKLKKLATEKLIAKNKEIRLKKAKRTIEELGGEK
ncbi:tetratricopeptide repeat protein [Mucilaginibacter sp.]|uniref:tetratricopeptide repeat protein n=1 Tax=Mucilaginibacter sp. TaxID=1882438 RepID=UPI0025EE667A|nr:tetratricopeptide repeat protein [Mucilaginibacter sp.]